VRPSGLRRLKTIKIISLLYGMTFGYRKSMGITHVLYANFIKRCFVTNFKASKTIHAEFLMGQEERIHHFHFFGIVHGIKIAGLRQALGKVFSDTNDRRLINPMNIQRDAIRFFDIWTLPSVLI
jgi:hypothetical protein